MCRITGTYFLKSHNQYNINQLNAMRDVLAHGGPDDAGAYFSEQEGIYLGHRRLSIIDTSSAGHQPMIWDNWVICYNGEVYNHATIAAELKQVGYQFQSHSDTEVIMKAFDYWGYAAVEKFRGMFAFALWNTVTKKLLLCRDRVGVKPLYYYQKDGVFLFASELKALHQFPGFDTTIDQTAVSVYLQAGYIHQPLSIYTYVRKLEPGYFLEIDEAGNIRKWSYWNLEDISTLTNDRTEQELIQIAESKILEAAQLRMVSDVPVGVFLSGGIDSSLITALLQHHSNNKIQTFTIGFQEKGFDESVYAAKIAAHLGTDHHVAICTEEDFLETIPKLADMYDEPFGDSSGIPTHLVASMAKKHVTVALSADGGDEVFGGYTRYYLVQKYFAYLRLLPKGLREVLANLVQQIPTKVLKKLVSIVGSAQQANSLDWRLPKLINTFQSETPFQMYAQGFTNIPSQQLAKLHLANYHHFLPAPSQAWTKNAWLSGLAKVDIPSYLEGDILTKVDRATMQVALEGREPLLDHHLIEFGLSLPDHYKYRNGETKWILRQVLKKHLPEHLWKRPKQGFGIPVKQWLQEQLKDDLWAMTNDQQFAERFQLNQGELKNLVGVFMKNKNLAINPHFMWSVYMLYSWHQRWN